jgi:hypothetical protein
MKKSRPQNALAEPPNVMTSFIGNQSPSQPMKRFAYILLLAGASVQAQQIQTYRPFGTLRQQADLQQKWLVQRINATVPTLMQKYGVEMWIVPMREYNEDPVFLVDRVADDVRRPAPDHLFVLVSVCRTTQSPCM